MSIAGRVVVGCIRAYKLAISPYLGPRCRFDPSCSTYGIEAVRVHGVVKGLCLTALRLCKCHPFHVGGFDPVPQKNARAPHVRGASEGIQSVT